MGESELAAVTRSSSSPSVRTTPFDQAKRHLLLACLSIGGGLAIAGSIDRTTGGVLVVAGWLAAVVSLHRLGRTGSDRGLEPRRPS